MNAKPAGEGRVVEASGEAHSDTSDNSDASEEVTAKPARGRGRRPGTRRRDDAAAATADGGAETASTDGAEEKPAPKRGRRPKAPASGSAVAQLISEVEQSIDA